MLRHFPYETGGSRVVVTAGAGNPSIVGRHPRARGPRDGNPEAPQPARRRIIVKSENFEALGRPALPLPSGAAGPV